MANARIFALSMSIFFLSFTLFRFVPVFAKDKKPTAEEIVSRHLESIGSPETLSAVKSRTVYGIVNVRMPLGTVPQIMPESGKRKDPSNFLFASAEGKMGMVMKFYDQNYPGEHITFDGKDSGVSITTRNQRSLLGNFILGYDGILKQGVLGGVLSTSWPLLHVQEMGFRLKYNEIDIGGKKYHQITCTPKSSRGLHDMYIRFLLEFDTYHHIMTEYIRISNNVLVFLERFGNFKSVDGLTLPYGYSIQDGSTGDTTAARWSVEIKQISHGESIDPQLLRAE